MNISNNITQNIQYRGHFGLESATPSSSTGHVILHEARHIREFKAEAAREGKTVRNEQIRVQYEFRDGKLIAVSGEATALIVDDSKKDINNNIFDKVRINEEGQDKFSSDNSSKDKDSENSLGTENISQSIKSVDEIIENKTNKLKIEPNGGKDKILLFPELQDNANPENKKEGTDNNKDNFLSNSFQNSNRNESNEDSDNRPKRGENLDIVL